MPPKSSPPEQPELFRSALVNLRYVQHLVPLESGEGRVVLRTGELERAMLWDGAPLLFLDAIGERGAAETLVRFRPDHCQDRFRQSRFLQKR